MLPTMRGRYSLSLLPRYSVVGINVLCRHFWAANYSLGLAALRIASIPSRAENSNNALSATGSHGIHAGILPRNFTHTTSAISKTQSTSTSCCHSRDHIAASRRTHAWRADPDSHTKPGSTREPRRSFPMNHSVSQESPHSTSQGRQVTTNIPASDLLSRRVQTLAHSLPPFAVTVPLTRSTHLREHAFGSFRVITRPIEGLIVGSMLYGLTLHQTYRYFKLYPKDRPLLKILVITILILETLHTTVWIIASYHYAISEAFNVAGLLHGHWSVRLTFIITGLAVFVCQSFYAYRVYLIGPRYRWLVAPAVVSIVGGLGFALAGGIRSFIIPPYIVDLQQIRWLVSVAYGLAVVTDVTLTSALIFVLGKSRTGWEKTDWVIDTLIKYSVNTGLLTSLASIVSFVFAIVIPGNLVYAGVSIVGAKLYANSVLAMLNSRRSIGSLFEDDFTSYSVPSLPANVHRSHAWRHSPTSVVCRVPESAMSSSLYTSRAVSQEMVFAMGTLH